MSLSPDQITIAITVYNRRQYIKQAIASALNQTLKVQVLVVEDCGPDPDLQTFARAEFGDAIQYVRNPVRRGLFGNWNACLDLCRTKWITILHDDDFLAPCFVQAMVDLEKKAPGCLLYFGVNAIVNQQGHIEGRPDPRPVIGEWMRRDLNDILYTPFLFPGHLFPVASARSLGGFRETSFLAGDWEMWAKLMAAGPAAQSAQTVSFCRDHSGGEKGTNQVIRQGRFHSSGLIQHKRILALFPNPRRFDRRAAMRVHPLSTKFLLRHGCRLRPRLLHYYTGLLLLSHPLTFGYRVYQACVRVAGPSFIHFSSKIWNALNSPPEQTEINSLR